MRRRGVASSGQGKVGCFLWAAVLVIAALVAYKAIPVKLQSVELFDYIDEQAQFSGRTAGEELRKRILKRAEELEVPLESKNLKIEKDDRRVRIDCHYTVKLDFWVYTYEWRFEHKIDRPIFII